MTNKSWLVAAATMMACSASKPDPTCARDTADLHVWLAALVATGDQPIVLRHTQLAVADEGPGGIATAPVIELGPRELTYQGRMIATLPLRGSGGALRETLATSPVTRNVLLVIDSQVAWSDVVTTVWAAQATGRTHITFVFAAGKPGVPAAPPPSDIDGLLADTSHPASRDVPRVVFERCPVDDLLHAMSTAEHARREQLIVDGLPTAIAACGCKVEMASVRRLLWAWYDRDRTPQMVGISVELAARDATRITAKPDASWADAAPGVRAAAKTGHPIELD